MILLIKISLKVNQSYVELPGRLTILNKPIAKIKPIPNFNGNIGTRTAKLFNVFNNAELIFTKINNDVPLLPFSVINS